MKKIIILSLAVFSAQYINAMEEQAQEKLITLRLKDNQTTVMPESELPFFTTIADAAQDAPDQEIPLKNVSVATMALLRKDVSWAWDIHKKINQAITAQDIVKMSAAERKSIAQRAAQELSVASYDIATLKAYVEAEASSSIDYLGAYELKEKCAGSIAAILRSDAYMNILRRHSRLELGNQSSRMCIPEDILKAIPGNLPYDICKDLWVDEASVFYDTNGIHSSAILADGKDIIVRNRNGYVTLITWNDQTNKWVNTSGITHEGDAASIAMSADRKTIVTFSNGSTQISQFSVVMGEEKWQEKHKICCEGKLAGISADGKTTIVASDNETYIVKWNDRTGKWLTTYKSRHGSKPLSALISKGGGTAVIAFTNTTQILKWHDQEKRWVESLDDNNAKQGPAAISADGNTVMAEFRDGRKIVRWSDQEKKWVEKHKFKDSSITLAKMSANGNTVVALAKDNQLEITMWNYQSEKWITHVSEEAYVDGMGLTVSPDGDTVIITRPNGGAVKSMHWHANDQKWQTKKYSANIANIVGLSLNCLTGVGMDERKQYLNIYECTCFNTFGSWEKKILATFLAWCKKNGAPVTESAWVKQVFETCDTREKRLLRKEYDTLLRVLTESGIEKFE